MLHLDMTICDSPEDAVEKGFKYESPEYQQAHLKKAVVVRKGTVNGHSTVDLIFENNDGNKFVAMISSNLLKMIPAFTD